jgi:hypothetical protein
MGVSYGSVLKQSASPASNLQYAAATIALIILGLIVPLSMTAATAAPGVLPEQIALQVLIVFIPAVVLSYFIGWGRPKPMLIAFSLFAYVWIGLAGLLQVTMRQMPWPLAVTNDQIITAQGVILVSYIALGAGYALAKNGPKRERAPRGIANGRLVGLTVAVVLSLPVAISALGGISALVSSREALALALARYESSMLGIVLAVTTIPVFVIWLVWWRRDGYSFSCCSPRTS